MKSPGKRSRIAATLGVAPNSSITNCAKDAEAFCAIESYPDKVVPLNGDNGRGIGHIKGEN